MFPDADRVTAFTSDWARAAGAIHPAVARKRKRMQAPAPPRELRPCMIEEA